MERSHYEQVLTSEIRRYARPVPLGEREDFIQDGWAHLLKNLPFADVCTQSTHEFGALVKLSLFRFRDNWKLRQTYRSSIVTTSGELETADSYEGRPDAQLEAAQEDTRFEDSLMALQTLLSNSERAFAGKDTTKIVGDLRQGRPQKTIALEVGVSPQILSAYVRRALPADIRRQYLNRSRTGV